ncbi:MAG: hypothetical protein K0S51_2497 [Bacillales bacterium]|jgi:hypothetical protein|nr:hypothetical protein [Bacillales bacterium]
MNKPLKIFIVMALGIALSSCKNKDVTPENKSKEVIESSKTESAKYENEAFKDVIANVTDDEVIITGKARVFEGVFQYALLTQDDEVMLTDHYQTEGAPTWGEFEIVLEKDMTTNSDVVFELFANSPNDGSKIHSLRIPLKN